MDFRSTSGILRVTPPAIHHLHAPFELVAGIEIPQFQSPFWSRSNPPKLHSPEIRGFLAI
ncbi:hypothetical protein OROHE_008338 [Orobanche hederae]